MENVIEIKDLTFAYPVSDGAKAEDTLKNVSLSIEKGTFTAVLGHNGSGKSTLAKHLNAILLPSGGSVSVFGMDTRDESLLLEIRRRTGLVFQNPDNQIVASVVEEDVAFAPENLGLKPAEIRERVDRALEMVGMENYALHGPHLLSGGQKQRVAIAGVLAMHPQCVVFDEATAMLDPKGRADVMDIIAKMKAMGTTVVLITHHMNEAALADRVIVMSGGRVCMDGTPRKVFSQVEKIRSLGLDAPDTVSLIYELNGCGYNIPLENLTAEECAEAIIKAVSK